MPPQGTDALSAYNRIDQSSHQINYFDGSKNQQVAINYDFYGW